LAKGSIGKKRQRRRGWGVIIPLWIVIIYMVLVATL
jgi:hypothetical protein